MTKESIVEKIRKLLRLARDKGASEAEAASAMAMAQKLMLLHDVQNVEDKVEELAVRGDWKNFEVDKKWQQILVVAVAKLYNCRSLTSRSGKVQFIGKPSNVLVCGDTLQWITEQVIALHKQGLAVLRGQAGTLTKRQYRDFRLTFREACALRIYHRVCDIVAKMRNEIPAHMALVVIDQALSAADDIIKADPNVKPASGKAMKLRKPGIGTGAGFAAGDMVKLQHAAAEHDQTREEIRELINSHREALGHRKFSMAELDARYPGALLAEELRRIEGHAEQGNDAWQLKKLA